MGLFKRRKAPETEPLVVQPPAQSRVEVELHKNASEQAAAKAKQVNEHVKDLLVENGFTLKIYLAAGGQLHQSKNRGGK